MGAPSSGSRDVMEVDWPFFGELCRALALKVAHDYDPELIIGIAKAGVIPGAVIASILQRDFASIVVGRPGSEARPTLRAAPPDWAGGKRVLLVDETCDSGDTLKVALAAVRRVRPADVRTAVSFKTGEYRPDYHALETESFIVLPWDRLVVENGKLVTRPDYARWLRET